MNRLSTALFGCIAVWCAASQAQAPTGADDPAVAALLADGAYDRELCVTAQRVILNAGAQDYTMANLRAEGTDFVSEQMATDPESGRVTVATLVETVEIGRKELAVDVACKLVNQDRVNDELQLDLSPPGGTCRDINELTYGIALSRLSDAQRQRYLQEGVPLRFTADYEARAGGEWLPSVISDFIRPVSEGEQLSYIEVQAPSVQVPWPKEGGDWYEGTHNCKLMTLAVMTRWMKTAAFDGSTELFPRPRPPCVEPDSRTSEVGSCLLYFGPAGGQFCSDFSGAGWTEATAREQCGIRYPSQVAWDSGNREYDGGGGIFSTKSCEERGVEEESRREPVNRSDSQYLGTCVFRCNTPKEALWHQLTPMAADPDGHMMEQTCDLFLKVDW
jgi:hypothetical protein